MSARQKQIIDYLITCAKDESSPEEERAHAWKLLFDIANQKAVAKEAPPASDLDSLLARLRKTHKNLKELNNKLLLNRTSHLANDTVH